MDSLAGLRLSPQPPASGARQEVRPEQPGPSGRSRRPGQWWQTARKGAEPIEAPSPPLRAVCVGLATSAHATSALLPEPAAQPSAEYHINDINDIKGWSSVLSLDVRSCTHIHFSNSNSLLWYGV